METRARRVAPRLAYSNPPGANNHVPHRHSTPRPPSRAVPMSRDDAFDDAFDDALDDAPALVASPLARLPRARGFRCAHRLPVLKCDECAPVCADIWGKRRAFCHCACYGWYCVQCGRCDGRERCPSCGLGVIEIPERRCVCGHREHEGVCVWAEDELPGGVEDSRHAHWCGRGFPPDGAHVYPCAYCGAMTPTFLLDCAARADSFGLCSFECWVDMNANTQPCERVRDRGTCPICYEDDRTLVRLAGCSHTVCEACWCDYTNPKLCSAAARAREDGEAHKCPICRAPNACE